MVAWSRDKPKRDLFNPSRLRIPARLALETLLEPLFIQSLDGTDLNEAYLWKAEVQRVCSHASPLPGAATMKDAVSTFAGLQ